ncbi:MAG: DNA internalization-related competence protein ComEC/Rec2 [Candidatus Binatia bacterium]
MYWIALGVLAGQLAAIPVPGGVPRVLAGGVAILVLGGGRCRPLANWAHATGLALLGATAGHWQADTRPAPGATADDVVHWAGGRTWVRGTVIERSMAAQHGMRLLIATQAVRRGPEWRPAAGHVLITVGRAQQPWRRGDALEAIVTLRRPRNFGNPGEFDYEAFLARRGVHVTAYAADDRGWRRAAAAISSWRDRLEQWRDETRSAIAAALPPREAAVAAALLVGEQAALSAEVRERYSRAGVSHVLSISGLHVALVSVGAYTALRWLLGRSERLLLCANVPKLAMTGSLVPVLFYAALAGSNVATVRAELMWLLVFGALLLDRPRDWLAPLAAAAAGLAIDQPGVAREISFQLSCMAVLGIAVGVPRARARWAAFEEARLLRFRHRAWAWLRWLALSEAATVSALVATAPLMAWHFNQISLVAPLANLIVVPLLGGLTIGLGLLGTLAVTIAPAAAPFCFAAIGPPIRLADFITTWFAALPAASVRVPTPSLVELALVYAALGASLLRDRHWRRIALALCGAALLVDASAWAIERSASGALRVTFLSVGQGDCTLIEFPGRHVMIVDAGGLTGGHFDIGARVVGPALWRRKITRIDIAVLTHADFDHYGGLRFLTETFAPRALWWNGVANPGGEFTALWRAVTAAGIPTVAPRAGTRREIDGVLVEVLHPGNGARSATDNDRSLTLRLRYGPAAVLLPGDIEAAGEAALVARWGSALASTVLKVPHHGSRSSSSPTFLAHIAPSLAVVSVGADNRFGFPDPHVERDYAARGIPLWRTDRDGAVALTITRDGAIAVTGGRGRRARLAPPAPALTVEKPPA